MTFKELAWGAFIFKFKAGLNDLSYYQPLASDKEFLIRLQTEPLLEDFKNLRNFLVHYGVHTAPKNLAQQYASAWPRLEPHIQRLSKECLESCDFNDHQIQDDISDAFCILLNRAWGGDTVVSKVLHFFNINLFVMIDSEISFRFKKYGPRGYVEFLRAMQRETIEVLDDYRKLGLPGRPEEFLSRNLNYKNIRPLTKLIDDYNWIAITQKWPGTPPDWLLNLFDRK